MKKSNEFFLWLLIVLFIGHSIVLAQIGKVNAEAARKPKLVVLGSYHMANPGFDRAKSEVDNVLQPKRQTEIVELVELLKQFKPTKIAVECPPKDEAGFNNKYQQYLKGEYELKSGEPEQIGFRLAKQMRVERLNCIDWNDYPVGDISNYDYNEFAQKDAELKSFLEKRSQKLQQAVSENDEILKNLSVVEQYKFLNQPENIDKSHQRYFDFVRIGRGDEYVGANYLSHWYGRNMKIFANLIRITDSPDDRILAIYGAGHAKLLNQFAKESGYYDVESPLKYLTKTELK